MSSASREWFLAVPAIQDRQGEARKVVPGSYKVEQPEFKGGHPVRLKTVILAIWDAEAGASQTQSQSE